MPKVRKKRSSRKRNVMKKVKRRLKPKVPLQKKISTFVILLDRLPKSLFVDADRVAFENIRNISIGDSVGRLGEQHLKILKRISKSVFAQQNRKREVS